jgi:hypothetical protein
MTKSFTQNKNENLIYRKQRETIFTKGSFNVEGLYEKISNELNKKEVLYSFPNSEERVIYIYNKNNYNIFLMHDEQVYLLFQKVSNLIKEACLEHEFSYSKNKYYLYSSLFEDQDPSYWYDAGGTSRPAMFGLISLDLNKTKVFINNTEFDVELGDILISEAGNKIVYSNQFKSILFYVSPLSEIKNQYSQKWIPLV